MKSDDTRGSKDKIVIITSKDRSRFWQTIAKNLGIQTIGPPHSVKQLPFNNVNMWSVWSLLSVWSLSSIYVYMHGYHIDKRFVSIKELCTKDAWAKHIVEFVWNSQVYLMQLLSWRSRVHSTMMRQKWWRACMCRSCSSPRYPSSGTSGGQALVGTASDPPTNKLSWASLAEATDSDKTMWIKGTPKKDRVEVTYNATD